MLSYMILLCAVAMIVFPIQIRAYSQSSHYVLND